MFNKEPNLSSQIFNEAQLPYSDRRFFKLPAEVWAAIFRVVWLVGLRGNSKSLAETKHSTDLGANILIEFATENKTVLLVEHGIINHLIAKALFKKRSSNKRKRGYGNLAYNILEMNL